MRLDFNVLWVDDQPNLIDPQIKGIATRMEQEGFRFNPTLCRSMNEVHDKIADHVFADEIDLILVDWDLGGGVHGDEAIAAIRDTLRYKDVVFYSALTPTDKLRTLASERGSEGVFCSDRAELVQEVIGVFESLIKKVLDIDHMRGIVMGATSDIDQMVNDCLTAAHGKLDAAGQQAMIEEVLARIDDKPKDLAKRIEKLRASATIAAMLDAHLIFTANDRLRLLGRTLQMDVFKTHAGAKAAIGKYIEKVVPKRNDLGHVVLIAQGTARAISTVGGKEVSLEEMRELRQLILVLHQEFKNLLDALRAQEVAVSANPVPPRPGK
jgi:hypothetical protein